VTSGLLVAAYLRPHPHNLRVGTLGVRPRLPCPVETGPLLMQEKD
jgi:hypothetical protein